MLERWTGHGGRLDAARRIYGGAEQDWLDLSTGINPRGWPGAPDVDWRALPGEDDMARLIDAASACFGVAPASVLALPGSEIGLRLLGSLSLSPNAACMDPSYRTHSEAFSPARTIVTQDIERVADEGGTLVIANPNNPDGRLIDPARLIAVAERSRRSGGWLVVDEAFADARPESSVANRVTEGLPLVVLRSFGKFFGLAGLRLGFAIGPTAIVDRLRACLGSWPVSTAAIAYGTAAYRDAEWIAVIRRQLASDADRLDDMLRRHGYRPMGDCPLFRLIETADAAALFERLARKAILTRPFDHHPRWLRIGLPGNVSALSRLDKALGHG